MLGCIIPVPDLLPLTGTWYCTFTVPVPGTVTGVSPGHFAFADACDLL